MARRDKEAQNSRFFVGIIIPHEDWSKDLLACLGVPNNQRVSKSGIHILGIVLDNIV
jgi:hypothetical protein